MTHPKVLALLDEIREQHWPNFDAGVTAAIERVTELASTFSASWGETNMAHGPALGTRKQVATELAAFDHLPEPEGGSDA